MTDRHAILTAIRETPDDDTPRLVFADWLEEHGEPERAELIRAQIERARIGGWKRPVSLALADIALESIRCHVKDGKVWLLPASRGICELVPIAWNLWREHGDLIWERELPWRVRLTTRPTLTAGGDIEYVGQTAKTKRYRVAGRIVAVGRGRATEFASEYHNSILAARWPGIDFELPPVGSRGPDSPQLRWRNFAMRYEDLPRG